MELIRKAGNRGRFYPSSAAEIEKMIREWNQLAGTEPVIRPEAIVSPHAGYVYSGFTANTAHRLLPGSKPERAVVIGPSHHVYLETLSTAPFDAFETPFGYLPGEKFWADKIMKNFPVEFNARAHFLEHSTETQFPFLAYYLKDIPTVEIIYGNISPEILTGLIDFVKSVPGTVVIISTDLSHYYPQADANRLDKHCIDAVLHRDLRAIVPCEACGKTGLWAVIQAAKEKGWQSIVTGYSTSGDITGDYSAVVGYMGAAFYQSFER